MPGNIVCGICGALRYYSFIMQAKKFGTFSCESCRKFISRMIKQLKGVPDNLVIDCAAGQGACVVPPIMRSTCGGAANSETSRCQACWLKLCLIGYNLESDLYDGLRSHLPDSIKEQLPEAEKRGQNSTLLPHRGQILEFSKQVPLSRPLFEGFGEEDGGEKAAQPSGTSSSPQKGKGASQVASKANAKSEKSSNPSASAANKSSQVHERLPNGWMKKAVKRLEGEQRGKWDTFLITPDQKMLKSPGDLKLYIAKSGAVVDSNIVNFSLPKKTAKVDKALSQQQQLKSEEPSPVKLATATPAESPAKISMPGIKIHSPVSREMRRLGFDDGTPDGRNTTSMELPRTARRETKVPAKFRDYSPVGRNKAKESKKKDKTECDDDEGMEVDVEEGGGSNSNSSSQRSSPTPPPSLKKEKVAAKKGVKAAPTTIGVGTFSIDKDAVRGKLVVFMLLTIVTNHTVS